MSLLLDTCTLLWFLSNDPKLERSGAGRNRGHRQRPVGLARQPVRNRDQGAARQAQARRTVRGVFPAQTYRQPHRAASLQVAHIEPLTTLPLHHKDPFDRLIAATALVEGLTLVSADTAFDAYGVTRLW